MESLGLKRVKVDGKTWYERDHSPVLLGIPGEC